MFIERGNAEQEQDSPEEMQELPENPWDLFGDEDYGGTRADFSAFFEGADEEDDEREISIISDVLFSKAKKIRKSHDEQIDHVFEDDLERRLAALIKTRVAELCNASSPRDVREKAAHWIFCSADDSLAENSFLSLQDALSVFAARPYVLQARVVYHLYMNCLPLQGRLPIEADPLPEPIAGELAGAFGIHNEENALRLASTLWSWPGMPLDILEETVQDQWHAGGAGFAQLLDAMALSGYVGISCGYGFMICRNPGLLGRKSAFQWSEAL